MAIYIIILFVLLISIPRIFVNGGIRIRRTPIDIAILLFFLAAVISSLNSRYIYGSATELIRLGNLGMVFYIAVNFIRAEKDIKRVLDIVLITAGAIAIFGVLQYLGVLDRSWWGNPRLLSATFVNHNHFAGYLELVIPVCLGMILTETDTGKKALYIYLFLILSAAFLLSMSRGGWFSLSIAMIFMAWIMFKKGKTRFILFMAILFFITLAIFVYNVVDAGVLFKRISSYRELDFSGRVEIWKGTLGIIRDNLFSGTGPGSFIYNFPKYRPAGLNAFINYTHNDYLQVASEMGIFALGIMIFIIWKIIKKGMRTHNIARAPFKIWLSLGLVTGILSMAIHSLVDFNFYIPSNAILFTVFSGFVFNISSSKEKKYPELVLKPNPAAGTFYKVFAPAIIAMLIVFISLSITAGVYSRLSDKFILRNDMKKAESLGHIASTLCPFDYVYHYKLAGIYNKNSSIMPGHRINYLKKAEGEYKKAIGLNSIDSWSWEGLADTYYSISQCYPLDSRFVKRADFSYKKALDLDPLNSYYLKKFAAFLLNSEDPGLSSRIYKKASSIMSQSRTLSLLSVTFTDGEKYEQSAGLAFAGQDIKKALIFYKMAEEFNTEKETAILGQIRCYMKLSSPKKALYKYKEIKSSAKNKSILFASLADYFLGRGLVESARRFSRAAIELDPDNPEGYQGMHKALKSAYGPRFTHAPESHGCKPVDEWLSVRGSTQTIKKILGFNQVPFSIIDRGSGIFEIRFDIKENLIREIKCSRDIVLPAGVYEINITAKGKGAVGVWPHMILRLNNIDVMDAYINDGDWKGYSGIAVIDYPFSRVDIIYDNDYYNSETKEDRNLHIDGISFISLY